MELLDRYLQAVKKHLPWERQDDIIAELKANLEAQLEDKESELGRPLTSAETEAWLKRMGAPFKVAVRYFPQQYLIGPSVFGMYWFVLRLALSWALIIYLVVSGVQLVAGSPSVNAAVEAVLRLPFVLMSVAAWVTLVFAVIEFGVTHYPSKFRALTGDSFDWSPSAMPPVEKEPASGMKPRAYTRAVAEVIFGFLGLIWLLLVPKHPYLLLGPGEYVLQALPLQLAPAWIPFYWWIIALNVLQLGWRCVDLVRGSWRGAHPEQHLVFKIVGLIPLALLLAVRNEAYITLQHPEVNHARYGVALSSINHAIHLGLMIVSVIVVAQLLWDMGKMAIEAYRKRAAVMR
jgi:hypothetical protein